MKVYFDNAATTPLHPKVFERMKNYLTENYGNPSSIHYYGRTTRVAIEEARGIIADFINADESEIYFTSGGTEANNFALTGITKAEFLESGKKKLIVSKADHHSIIDTAKKLKDDGFSVHFCKVNSDSEINFNDLKTEIDNNTSLLSIIHVNNETGTINPINKIIDHSKNIYMHTDAIQSFGKISINVKKLRLASLSASSHKINGPKGAGFLYVKSGTPITPLIFGGSQERNRRGGTENVAAIIGFAEAVRLVKNEISENYEHVKKLREYLLNGLKSIDKEGITINGGNNTIPHILSVTFKSDYYNNDAEAMLIYLDINGIAVSNGAACTSGTLKPSHVMLASGKTIEDANGTIRFSFGSQNSLEEIEYTLEVMDKFTKKFKK